MVDSIQGLGNITAIGGAKKTQPSTDVKKPQDTQRGDEVKISQAALDLQQAEKAAKDAKDALSNSDVTLGLNPDFEQDA